MRFIASDAVASVSSGLPIAGGRNVIINGAMNVWQRGTSIPLPLGGGSYVGPDRWWYYNNGFTSSITREPCGSTLPQFQYCARLQRTSGQTGTAAMVLNSPQETVNSVRLAGKTVTLSFYARASSGVSSFTSLRLSVRTGTGTDQNNLGAGAYTNLATPISFVPTLTTSWQRFSGTASVNSTATEVSVEMQFTPTGTAGASDYVEITGIQLEEGAVATPFEFEDYGTTLAKCQRYYYKSYSDGTNPGSSVTATYGGLVPTSIVDAGVSTYAPGYFSYPVAMRTAPTLTYYDAAGNLSKFSTLTGGGLARTDNVGAVYSLYTSTSSGFYIALPGAGTWANIMIVAAAEL